MENELGYGVDVRIVCIFMVCSVYNWFFSHVVLGRHGFNHGWVND